MNVKPRALVVAAFGIGPLLLASGCGSETTGARSTLANIQPSSYVTIQPATTTTTVVVSTTLRPGTSSEAQSYTVQGGDSVSAIASRYGIGAEVLANFNSWEDGIFHAIFPGDVIQIPPGATVPGGDTGGGDTADTVDEDTAADDTADDESGAGCSHTVVEGDNPSRLAEQYEVTLEQLNVANANNPAYSQFLIGQQIIIPPDGDC